MLLEEGDVPDGNLVLFCPFLLRYLNHFLYHLDPNPQDLFMLHHFYCQMLQHVLLSQD